MVIDQLWYVVCIRYRIFGPEGKNETKALQYFISFLGPLESQVYIYTKV